MKYKMGGDIVKIKEVAPLAGAWIEISAVLKIESRSTVAPLAGAWIEM